MCIRRAIVGLAMTGAVVVAPDRASALTCYTPPPSEAVMTAAAVFEATIASRRPLDPLLFRVLAWLGVGFTNLTDRYELSLADVTPLRGVSASTIRTGYSFLTPGGRYVFIARKRWLGSLIVGTCVGDVIEASKAIELKEWIATLPR